MKYIYLGLLNNKISLQNASIDYTRFKDITKCNKHKVNKKINSR